MTDLMDDETRLMIKVVGAAGPELTYEQVTELRRVFPPNQYAPVVDLPAKPAKTPRRAA